MTRNFLYISQTGDGWQNLGLDEWFLDHVQDDDLVLYFYINQNAVIIGRNQNPWKECNLSAMERDGVQLVRRISGGGAVYHDNGNLNFSFIAGKNRYDVNRQFALIMQTVRDVGIPCEFSGRNDILTDGKKFSGNAFCSREDRRQHHGTLLVNANLNKLSDYLHVDPRKMQSKGIASVRSRVCNLCDIVPTLTVDELKSRIPQAFGEIYGHYETFEPTAAQKQEIAAYTRKHASWEWRIGKTPKFDIEFDTRFAWGGVQLLLSLEKGRVVHTELFTDANDAELPALVASLLNGTAFDRTALCASLLRSDKDEIRDLAVYLSEQNF